MQLVSPCDEEQLVQDVHAVFFGLWCFCVRSLRPRLQQGSAHLVAGIHVHAPPKTVVEAAIFLMSCRVGGHGHAVFSSVELRDLEDLDGGRSAGGQPTERQEGRTERGRAALTHSRPC